MKKKGLFFVAAMMFMLIAGCGSAQETEINEEEFLLSTSDHHEAAATTTESLTVATSDTNTSGSATTSALSDAIRTIPFTVVDTVRTYNSTGVDSFSGQVIRSREELEKLSLDDCSLTRYNEAYFVDKALLVLYVTLESGSMQLQIDELALQDKELTVHFTTIRPNPFTTDMAYWQVLVEVSSDEVGDVKTVTGERRQVNLSSTW